jgi:hypothetical protein
MDTVAPFSDVSWERMARSVEKVRERLQRAASALEAAGISYAVSGGNAVAAWVSTVDEAAVRTTRDVDILVRREDLTQIISALEVAGFRYRHAAGIDMFVEGTGGKFVDAVHLLFANEKVRDEYVAATPGVEEFERPHDVRVISLEPLVRMKLTSFRDKDRLHLRDLIAVGLVDATWPQRFQSELAERLHQLLDDPDG